jgi:two-component system response regulator AtoC
MQTVEVGGFQTRNTKLAADLQKLNELSCYDRVLIIGEHGSGRRLYAQELATQMHSRQLVRFQSGTNLSEIQKGDCVLVEEIEALLPHEQQLIARMIDDLTDVRWIFIASHDVKALAEKGLIAKDLCQKIEAEVSILPLRERKEDFDLICDSILGTLAWMTGKIKKLDVQAVEKIKNYNWPGNVAELEKTLEKAFVKTDSKIISASNIEIQDFLSQSIQLCTLNEMERKLILQTLEMTQNNKSQAARILGISIRTLRNKLTVYRQEGFYESNV